MGLSTHKGPITPWANSWADMMKRKCPACPHDKGFHCKQCWPQKSDYWLTLNSPNKDHIT